MNCKYRVRQDEICDEEGHKHKVYGVEMLDDMGQVIKSISDIFSNREDAERFVELCNSEGLSDLHFDDVVMDLILYL